MFTHGYDLGADFFRIILHNRNLGTQHYYIKWGGVNRGTFRKSSIIAYYFSIIITSSFHNSAGANITKIWFLCIMILNT